MSERSLVQELEARVEALGYEFVELEQAGTRTRPVLRLRIDRPAGAASAAEVAEGAATAGKPAPQGVTVEDCTRVSRAIETWLEESGEYADTYVLEVSSPGVERPLVKRRDFERFAGREISVRGHAPLAGRAKRLQGELLGVAGEAGAERVRLRLEGGEEIEIPRAEITRAQLVFRWNDRAG